MNYMVIIVDDPEKGLAEDNLKGVGFKGPEKCQHLVGDKPGEYSCAIHDKEWYHLTPCYAHDQIGREDAPCRIGSAILEKISWVKECT